ncbi:hypothetical protein PGT21_018326 [Puccinia graminis f. sp. tritici]|uniref:Uncharacterized protein n=1 Tax=Puccinia graminis f. sp. tritici TaxID=56615 RepID=A0A5B0MN15_PUCGR|nr:hypothetical protein PGT21_018326 [Puccinia graminis f. sp. tritici]
MSMTQIRSGNRTILLLAFTQNSSLPDREWNNRRWWHPITTVILIVLDWDRLSIVVVIAPEQPQIVRPPQLEPLRQSVGLFAAPELTATLQPQQTSATRSSAPNDLGILLPFRTVLPLPPSATYPRLH